MNPNEIKSLIKTCYKARKSGSGAPVLFLQGSPGCGKTQVTYQTAEELTQELDKPVPCYVFQATLYDPVEIKGLPIFTPEGTAKFLKFEDMPTADEGILFIDDLPHAPTQTQNAFMRVVLEGIAGAWNTGGLYSIIAGNKTSDRAGAKDLQTAMANRLVFIEFNQRYEDWRQWAVGKGIAAEIVSYLATPYGGDWLNKFDPTKQNNATPRSWEFASQLINMFKGDQTIKRALSGTILRESLHGCIGQEAAAKFIGWLNIYDKLPDLMDIIKGKNIYTDSVDSMYAIISGLVSIARSMEKKAKVFQRLIDYSLEVPKEHTELGVWLGKDIYTLDPQAFRKLELTAWRKRYENFIAY